MTTLIEVRGSFFDSTEIDGEISTLNRWENVELPIHLSHRFERRAVPSGWNPDGKYDSLHQLTAGVGSWKVVYGNLRRFIKDGRLKHLVKADDDRDMAELGRWLSFGTGTVELRIEYMDDWFRSRIITNGRTYETEMDLERLDLRQLELIFGNPNDNDEGSATTFGRWSDVQLTSGELHAPFWEFPAEPEPPVSDADLKKLRGALDEAQAGIEDAYTWLQIQESKR